MLCYARMAVILFIVLLTAAAALSLSKEGRDRRIALSAVSALAWIGWPLLLALPAVRAGLQPALQPLTDPLRSSGALELLNLLELLGCLPLPLLASLAAELLAEPRGRRKRMSWVALGLATQLLQIPALVLVALGAVKSLVSAAGYLYIALGLAAWLASFAAARTLKRRLSREHALTPLRYGELYQRAAALGEQAGVRIASVALLEEPDSPAGAVAAPDGSIILSAGLLRRCSQSELDAVLLHEMAHLRFRHPQLTSMLIAQLFALYALGVVPLIAGALPAGIYWPPLIVLALILAGLRLLRRWEYKADRFSARMLGDPRPLASALRKIAEDNGIVEDLPRALTAFHIHPRLAARLRALAGED